MKPVAYVAALVLTLGAGVAGAETFPATVEVFGGAVFFGTGTRLVGPGSFEDLMVVSWSPPPTGGLATASITSPTGTFNIGFTSVALYDNETGAGAAVFTTNGPDFSFSDQVVTANTFSVKLIGTAGNSGGQYAMTGNVVAVPEPETYAMMLAGVVAVGFMAARRRRRN